MNYHIVLMIICCYYFQVTDGPLLVAVVRFTMNERLMLSQCVFVNFGFFSLLLVMLGKSLKETNCLCCCMFPIILLCSLFVLNSYSTCFELNLNLNTSTMTVNNNHGQSWQMSNEKNSVFIRPNHYHT